MKQKLIFLMSLFLLTSGVTAQDYSADDMYPETDSSYMDGGELNAPPGLPETDYEEVPREEQEYYPDQPYVDQYPAEDYFESEEEYVE